MNNIEKILRDYTEGVSTLEEANAALKSAGTAFHLDPEKNTITEAERSTHGLLDTGTGTMNKVRVVDGHLEHAVNEVQKDGSVNMLAYVYFNGKRYQVRGADLVEGI